MDGLPCHTSESESEKQSHYWPVVPLANMVNNSGGSIKGQAFVKRIKQVFRFILSGI